jgi:hypothetical protein
MGGRRCGEGATGTLVASKAKADVLSPRVLILRRAIEKAAAPPAKAG